jgi:hypothetical protein
MSCDVIGGIESMEGGSAEKEDKRRRGEFRYPVDGHVRNIIHNERIRR